MASFANRYLSEIESGKGLIGGAKSAASDTAKGIGKKFGKENLVRTFFGGDDIFSAMIRGKLGVKKKPSKETGPEKMGGADLGGDSSAFLKIIAKNSMSIPGMARDMNVMRQNIQKLVKLKGGKARGGADAFFLREDERERALESQKEKVEGTKTTPAAPGASSEQGGFLDSILSMFSGGFMNGIKSLFSPKMLGNILKKVFLPVAIIGTLFSGIMDGWKRYQETGNFGDAIVAGLGGALKFLTFGLFGEDTLKNLWSSVSDFLSPITDTISNIFNGIKNFFLKMFGKDVPVEDTAPPKIEAPKNDMPDTKQFAIDAAKASGASDEKAQDLGGIFDAVGKGDTKGLFEKAQAFAAKYPEPTPTEKSPEPADRGEPTPTLGGGTGPTPATMPSASGDTPMVEKHRKLAKGFSMGNANSPQGIAQELSYVQTKRDFYAANRDKAMELGMMDRFSEYDKIVGIYDARINELLDMQSGKSSSSPTPSGPEPEIPSGGASGGSSPSSSASGGAAGGATPTAGGGTASLEGGGGTSPSGQEVSTASSEVAEGQRMESAADQGSVVNAGTTNNSSGSADNIKPPVADAFNNDFVKTLMRT